MQNADLRAWLLARAQELGFAKVGLASCESFEGERSHLDTWFGEGRGELLPYLDPRALLDPRSLMPTARTALVGFFPYARPDAVPGAAPGSLRVSRYLWGGDYHALMKARFQRLLEGAQERLPGIDGRICVDTAPILERQLAVRAGLGWQGKHTLLIAGKGGSWGFLGVLLLGVELEPDTPFPGSRCGSCTACLDACPTGALSPCLLEPRRCLSTYTLESEAEPPPEVLAAMPEAKWVAGCDRCQEVCPWNREPLWGDPELWGGPSPLHTLGAEDLPRNTSQWKKVTRRTGLRRVRHRHWLATLARVLGN
ncbi:tRNA epoxyqueuosine(34) reductase QueG [Holophaga foetida]|uniref:tRNA epoxyqueuosine(34) reductase QueG n=1 Tax=Holophaga foetida TaxID=35839 RepID=UPI0002472AFA|nr:tRNA epoxyqueuosine(34) reductase QueG [Holophaga foetida]